MDLGDPTQMEETKLARHEKQLIREQSENRLNNLDFSSNNGSLEKVKHWVSLQPRAI